MNELKFTDIDGSVLEGGGQILRMAISLSALTGVPVHINKIRAGRSKPGLAPQHMNGILLVADMCSAKTRGVEMGSTEVYFTPGKIVGGRTYDADPKTAGSISLMLQVALPCALFAERPVVLRLKGGTNVDMAPQIDYMSEVFRPNLEKFGASFDLDLQRRGYFPRGGGDVTIMARPVRALTAVRLTERGEARKLYGWSFVAGSLPMKLSYEMSEGAKESLRPAFNMQANIECYKEDAAIAADNCNGIVLVCETSSGCILGGASLGRRGLDPRSLGRSAAEEINAAYGCGACVDSHAQDQLIIFMSLARGQSAVRVGEVTMHTKTAIHIAEILTKCKFNIEQNGASNVISCSGVGLLNDSVAVK